MRITLENVSRISILIFIYILTTSQSIANGWTKIAPGIEYQDLDNDSFISLSHIHAFKVSLKHNTLKIAIANKHAFVDEFANNNEFLIAINGGFFDKEFNSLGLRISNKHQYNPIKKISWWGIFYIHKNQAYIKNIKSFNSDKNIEFAIQSGPRLIIEGKIPSLKPGFAERTALGITKTGEIIVLVTKNSPLTTTSLAKILKNSPLNCENAINLDGGGSSQLYANLPDFKLNSIGFSEVSDFIIVKPI